MPNCDHIGPEQVVEYAEERLRERGLAPEQWDGARYAWAGNVDEHTSVHVEVVREHGDWRVTKLERRKSAIPESESGYRAL
ncbi:MAG TPA: hypothetical protein VI670_02660 [Thermoanaerobaculia bacterium]|jgi:hypothetical protein